MSILLTDDIKPKHKKVMAIAYIAPWRDGTLGWVVPNFIHEKDISRPRVERYDYAKGEWVYRCKVTIELAPDKRGRIRRLRVR